jgi:hypothetical protein
VATLHPDQVQRVLRRAAELEQRDKPEAAQAASGQMTRGDVTQIAEEVGLPPEAVSRALAELDAGLLAERQPAGFLDRLIGPADVVCTRSVSGPPAQVRAQVERFLRSQLMQVKRNLGERGMVWEPAGDLVSRVRRAFDIGQRVALPRDCALESDVVADPEDATRVLVRLSLRLQAPRQKRVWSVLTGVVAGAALAAGGIAAFHTAPAEALSVAAGSATAVGSWMAARKQYRRDLGRAETGLLRFLDALEHERV